MAYPSLMQDLVQDATVLSVALDKVTTELAWLEEQGYLAAIDYGLRMAFQLTSRGWDLASRHADIPGIQFVQDDIWSVDQAS